MITQFDKLLRQLDKYGFDKLVNAATDNLPKILAGIVALDILTALGKGPIGGAVLAAAGVDALGLVSALAIFGGAAGTLLEGANLLEKAHPGMFKYDPITSGEGGYGGDPGLSKRYQGVLKVGNQRVYREAMGFGTTQLMAMVASEFPDLAQYPITSGRRYPVPGGLYADPGHQHGFAIDVGVGYDKAGYQFIQDAIRSGLFQHIGTNPAWVAQMRAYAQALGEKIDIFPDPGTGPHAHLEIDPDYWAEAAHAQQQGHQLRMSKTVKKKLPDGRQYNVKADLNLYIFPELLPKTPTTSSSRTGGLGP